MSQYRRITEFLRGLPLLKQLTQMNDNLASIRQHTQLQARLAQETYYRLLLNQSKYSDPTRLNTFEGQVLSQNGEDGILSEIFRRIGVFSRRFVEIGVGDGMENNTAYLLAKGWSGYWVDADMESLNRAQHTFRREIGEGRLKVRREFVTTENVSAILERGDVPGEFDLLSLDIDRNTSHVWKALLDFRPRVVVIEYNASIPPSDSWEVQYNSTAVSDGSLHFGGSLKALECIGKEMGYCLVGCESGGVNAFFVRNDLVKNHFCCPFTSENHYEPPRYFLVRTWGHRRSVGD